MGDAEQPVSEAAGSSDLSGESELQATGEPQALGSLEGPEVLEAPEPVEALQPLEALEPLPPEGIPVHVDQSQDAPLVHARLTTLETKVLNLHRGFQGLGINSTGATDVYGREFALPVDLDNKAVVFNCHTLWGCSNPHQRGFWASAFAFFSTFFSTFAAAPLMAYIREPDALGLSTKDVRTSEVTSIAGTVVMRLIAGWLCEKIGPRWASISLLMISVPGIIGIALTFTAAGFATCRLIIGLGLGCFVTCQAWCSNLFNNKVIGQANATSAGWGNMGGGITNLIMPYVMLGFLNLTDDNVNLSWRLCYILPLALHLIASAFVYSGRDLPDGRFRQLEADGLKKKAISTILVKVGASNLNAWILVVTYGFCFGVELTMTNVSALYFYEYHGVTPQLAGIYASVFGLMNLFARSMGGALSDAMCAKFGVRGRLWGMWIMQMIEGGLCLIAGLITIGHSSPDSGLPQVVGEFEYAGDRYTLLESDPNYMIDGCATRDLAAPDQFSPVGSTEVIDNGSEDYNLPSRILLADMHNPDCIRNNSKLLGYVVFTFIMYSVAVQMAEGLHFGVVPYVAPPAMGIVIGMVAAGGNLGGVIILMAIFRNTAIERTDEGFVVLGVVIMVTSVLMFGIYFNDHGGMLVPRGALQRYNPQLFKLPYGYRGSNVLDYTFRAQERKKRANARGMAAGRV